LKYSLSEEDQINVTMMMSKGKTNIYTKKYYVNIIPKFEIISVYFPQIVEQGAEAHFIVTIQNNLDKSESFTLLVNGEQVTTNLNALGPGINRIVFKVIPSINPYDFSKKSFIFELKDGSNNPIARYYYEIQLELSSFNLIVFYVLPVLIPICIALIYKNKEVKHRLLRR